MSDLIILDARTYNLYETFCMEDTAHCFHEQVVWGIWPPKKVHKLISLKAVEVNIRGCIPGESNYNHKKLDDMFDHWRRFKHKSHKQKQNQRNK